MQTRQTLRSWGGQDACAHSSFRERQPSPSFQAARTRRDRWRVRRLSLSRAGERTSATWSSLAHAVWKGDPFPRGPLMAFPSPAMAAPSPAGHDTPPPSFRGAPAGRTRNPSPRCSAGEHTGSHRVLLCIVSGYGFRAPLRGPGMTRPDPFLVMALSPHFLRRTGPLRRKMLQRIGPKADCLLGSIRCSFPTGASFGAKNRVHFSLSRPYTGPHDTLENPSPYPSSGQDKRDGV
jgi:hypothetical protein